MRINELYDTYAALEQLPVDARAAEASAAKRRSDALARLDEKASRVKQAAEAAKHKLQADLRFEAQAASAKGAISKSGSAASGSQPNFSRVRSLREKLEGLLADKARASKDLDRLRSDLHALEKQIAEELRNEGLWARAKLADVITCSIGGIGVLLSITGGPGLLGVTILMTALATVGYRLGRRSAMMMRATQKRPALGSHRKFRLGFILKACGWTGAISLILNLVLTAVLNDSGTGLALGELRRNDLDSYWFLGMFGTLAVLVAGHRAQRGS